MSVTSRPAHPNSGTHPPLPRPARGSSPPSSRLHPGFIQVGPAQSRLHPPRPALPLAPSTSPRPHSGSIHPGARVSCHIDATGFSRIASTQVRSFTFAALVSIWHETRGPRQRLTSPTSPSPPTEGGTGVTPRRHSRTHTVDAGAYGNAKPPLPETRRRGRRCQIAGVGQSSTSPCAGRS